VWGHAFPSGPRVSGVLILPSPICRQRRCRGKEAPDRLQPICLSAVWEGQRQAGDCPMRQPSDSATPDRHSPYPLQFRAAFSCCAAPIVHLRHDRPRCRQRTGNGVRGLRVRSPGQSGRRAERGGGHPHEGIVSAISSLPPVDRAQLSVNAIAAGGGAGTVTKTERVTGSLAIIARGRGSS
jgi:hypothetical protein